MDNKTIGDKFILLYNIIFRYGHGAGYPVPNRLEPDSEPEPFATGSEPRNRETAGKKLPEP